MVEVDPVERFRRGNGSELPSKSLLRLVNVALRDVGKFDIEFVSKDNVPFGVELKRRLRIVVLVEPLRVDIGSCCCWLLELSRLVPVERVSW